MSELKYLFSFLGIVFLFLFVFLYYKNQSDEKIAIEAIKTGLQQCIEKDMRGNPVIIWKKSCIES